MRVSEVHRAGSKRRVEKPRREEGGARSRTADSPAADDDAFAAQSRALRNSLISLAVFFAIVAGLLLAVPGLHAASERISHANVPG